MASRCSYVNDFKKGYGTTLDGGMKHLQICMFDFYQQQVQILRLDVKVENVLLQILEKFEK